MDENKIQYNKQIISISDMIYFKQFAENNFKIINLS